MLRAIGNWFYRLTFDPSRQFADLVEPLRVFRDRLNELKFRFEEGDDLESTLVDFYQAVASFEDLNLLEGLLSVTEHEALRDEPIGVRLRLMSYFLDNHGRDPAGVNRTTFGQPVTPDRLMIRINGQGHTEPLSLASENPARIFALIHARRMASAGNSSMLAVLNDLLPQIEPYDQVA